MIDPDVRSAAAADAGQLEMLEDEARRAVADRRGGDRWLETHPSRAGRWTATMEDADVLVAHIGDVVVGYLVLEMSGSIATIDDVFVLPEARELGFGDALLAAALDRARSAGCARLEGESLPGDRDTKNLYERAGITARLITVSTRL